MSFLRIVLLLIFFLTISLTACGTESTPAEAPVSTPTQVSLLTEPTPESQTDKATATPIPTFTPSPTAEPTATNTPVSTATPEPAATDPPSPTPEPDPAITIDDTLTAQVNIRSGPGTDYPVIARFDPGQQALVLGRIENFSWWRIDLPTTEDPTDSGWVFAELAVLTGKKEIIPLAEIPPLPPTPTPNADAPPETEVAEADAVEPPPQTAAELADELYCGKDFCVTYQAMVPIWENGGCVGNHSIYITVLEGPPPGKPMDGVVIGDTYNNVEVGSGSHGPGRTEITLWNNSMTLIAKRHMDGTPYTSEESFNFTAADELIPAEVLAANGYCEGRVDVCEYARNHNSVCRGHYSWRVTFHKLD